MVLKQPARSFKYFLNTLVLMDIEIVEFNIPILVSNAAMRQMGMGMEIAVFLFLD